ncbi:MAG: DNA-directed RNA polymerase subunit omega [Pelagibacteraceae bacterium TMED65]|nr:DNA-directed RNA polymerase subunit omega [Rickettsiales bacterium]OUU52765.1 MAG: DNA-directed RNA polymerase subunit omega [Pelagibacteraceae bacterium TMED65]
MLVIMARVTTEDCITSIPNRFQLVIYACNRARDLTSGTQAGVSADNDKNTVIALREIAEKKIDLIKTWEAIVNASQKYQPVEETDIDDDQTIPMNENASQVSFDNFEKENASEKKRKKIYMTQNEIQKLISQKKNNSDESESTEVEDSPNLKEEIE